MNAKRFINSRAVLPVALLILFLCGAIPLGLLLTPQTTLFPQRVLPTLSPDGHNIAINRNQSRNRPVQALYHVEALAVQVGWTPDLHRQAGDLWHRLGDSNQALFHWQQAAQTQSDDALLLRSIAEVYMTQAAWAQATDVLEQLVTTQPENTWVNYHLGLLRAPFNPAAAEPYLRQAAVDPLYNEAARAVRITIIESTNQPQPDPTLVPMLMGLTMLEFELWAYAELAFNHANVTSLAISGDPFPEALAYLSLTQDRQGENGREAALTAVRLRPNDPQIRYLLALHLRSTERYAASLDAMIQAVALEPENPALYAELGTAYRLVGDLEEAEYWFQTAVSASESAPEYLQLLSLFYAEEAPNLGSDGLSAITETLDMLPNDPDLLAGMGWALFAQGDEVTGREQVEAALEIDPNSPRALLYKARILLFTGEDDALALRLLQQVIDSDTVFSDEAQRVLESL